MHMLSRILEALGRAKAVGVLTHNDPGFGYQYIHISILSSSSYSAVSTWNI